MLPLPSVDNLACILHVCSKQRNRANALRLHAYTRRSALEAHASLGNYLVSTFVEVGSMYHAHHVFDRMNYPNENSWNSLIAGYIKCGEPHHALFLYRKMQEEDSLHPNQYTFVALLKACTKLKDLVRGSEIHAQIARKGLLETDLFLGSTLVDMYGKCGSLAKAQEVFDILPIRNIVSWTALIAGYVEHGYGEKALDCFERMQQEGVCPDDVTFVCILKACGSIGATYKGGKIHAEVTRKGLETDLIVGSTLVNMYAKCGSLTQAQDVFDKLPVHNVVSWTALIVGYTEHGHGKEALDCLKQMQWEGVSPDAVMFACSLKACGSIGATDKGRELHAQIARKGMEIDLVVGNTLIDMYAKCGLLVEAQEVFEKLPVRTVVSWNALIAGYVEHGLGVEALGCFKRMQYGGVSPDAVTLACSLKACGSMGAMEEGQEIHAEIARQGLEKDILLGNTLVDMYAKGGFLAKAWEVFDKLPVRDVVSWTALIYGYAEHGSCEEALDCFDHMQHEGVSPDAVTFVCTLKACGSIGATDKGQDIHAEIVRNRLERDLIVGSTLVDMYAQCGLLAKAHEVFDKLPVRNVVSWNALITGYAQLGESEKVFCIFDRMIGEDIQPNVVTFVSVLNACSHTGLVEEGQMYLEGMSKDYGIIPTLEHHNCIADLLSRAGHADKAVAMIKEMPFHPGVVVWHSVLGACQKWGNVELGRQAFKHAVRLDEKDIPAYVSMFNIYANTDV